MPFLEHSFYDTDDYGHLSALCYLSISGNGGNLLSSEIVHLTAKQQASTRRVGGKRVTSGDSEVGYVVDGNTVTWYHKIHPYDTGMHYVQGAHLGLDARVSSLPIVDTEPSGITYLA